MEAVSSSFYAGNWPVLPTSPPSGRPTEPSGKPVPGKTTKGKSKGVPKGAVAGVAIVMLAVGILGGLVIAHVIMKRRGTGLFRYQRQL